MNASSIRRPLKAKCGVTVDDIAKRLIDYGFHAPTMSFPVPGTLMIEPTELESKAELDRFCEAMIAIRKEIAEIEAGRFEIAASPLRHAPHTVHDIADDAWNRAYGRSEGCFPDGVSRTDKYWCPVGPRRQCLWRPQSGVFLSAGGGLRRGGGMKGGSCPGRGAALGACARAARSADPSALLRRAGTHVFIVQSWTPAQQRTAPQVRRGALHPGNETQPLSFHEFKSSVKSRQSGLSFSIRAIFHARRHRFNECSRARASRIDPKASK